MVLKGANLEGAWAKDDRHSCSNPFSNLRRSTFRATSNLTFENSERMEEAPLASLSLTHVHYVRLLHS